MGPQRPTDARGGPDGAETVRLQVTNPDAEVIDAGAAVWWVSAVPDPGVRAAVEDGATFEEVRALLCESPGEYSVVQVAAGDDLTIRAHRGVTSSYEVYTCRAADGTVILTDLFRNAVASREAANRTVTDDIVASHLLYRTVPTGTYVAEVRRLGHGETLTWTPSGGDPVRELTETLSPQPTGDGVEALDDALATAVVDESGDRASMLSGGVDSTLLHTYLPGDTPSTSAAFETPEFDFEVDYARTASELLDSDHDLVTAPESEFGTRLEAVIDAVGMPPQQLQAPTIDLCFRGTDHDTYVCGEAADSLYGMGAGLARVVWHARALRHVPAVHPKLATLGERAEQLLRSPWDPRGTAQQSSQYLDQDRVAVLVDRGRIDCQQLRRLAYTRSRVPLAEEGSNYAVHMDWGHWIGRYCENTLTAYRQIAQARGAALRAPFATRAVTEAALRVPSPDRYVAGRESKPIPKRLLDRKLPAYRTSKPKGNGNLPVARFLRDGPLAPLLERYDLPSFAAAESWEAVVDESPGMAWVLLSWAVWRDRVLENDDIGPAPHTRTVEVSA